MIRTLVHSVAFLVVWFHKLKSPLCKCHNAIGNGLKRSSGKGSVDVLCFL
jgi:hypothetical protein